MSRILLSTVVLVACYKVDVAADPLAAVVELPSGSRQAVPVEVTLKPSFKAQTLVVSAGGHRDLTVRLRWSPLRWLGPRPEVEVRLVEDHGPAGTWTR